MTSKKIKKSYIPIDVIIPTYDNFSQLSQCVNSILSSEGEFNIIIVNNGSIRFNFGEKVTVLESGENLGWVGGIRYGLEHSKSEFVCLANDDIFIPDSSRNWLTIMMKEFSDEKVGAVGPTSNVVMGRQNIWSPVPSGDVNFLIGFFMLIRKHALVEAGGIHDVQFGGDDLDLSIRIRKAGYRLRLCRDVFIYHHGFQTGNKVYGTPDKPGGWNSREMTENINMELIRKHGMREWWETMR